MDTSKATRAFAGLVVAAGLAGCDPDDITKVNENPNSPTNAPAGAVFTNAVINGSLSAASTGSERKNAQAAIATLQLRVCFMSFSNGFQ